MFEYDPEKARINEAKHDVTFAEAETVFGDFLASTKPDSDHSDEEERQLAIGTSARNRLLVVSYTERGDKIRLISARQATPQERRGYENERNN